MNRGGRQEHGGAQAQQLAQASASAPSQASASAPRRPALALPFDMQHPRCSAPMLVVAQPYRAQSPPRVSLRCPALFPCAQGLARLRECASMPRMLPNPQKGLAAGCKVTSIL
jgi:hypothetical protein